MLELFSQSFTTFLGVIVGILLAELTCKIYRWLKK